MILNGLLKNSIAAYFAAIEIHNKPNVDYRYETTTVLMLNAWELLLKAFVRKYSTREIFLKGGNTIKFKTALDYAYSNMDASSRAWFDAPRENLQLLERYRNTYSHYYDADLDPIIFSMLAKAAISYCEFFRRYFNNKMLDGRNLFILPLGFNLPFEPEAFLGNEVLHSSASKEVVEFLSSIVEASERLEARGTKDSILVRFDISFGEAKNVSNADLLASIKKDGGIPLHRERKVRITNEPGAAPVNLDDSQFFELYPLTYGELVAACREKILDFKLGKTFNELKRQVQKDVRFAKNKSNNRDGSGGRCYYTKEAVDEIARNWPASKVQ